MMVSFGRVQKRLIAVYLESRDSAFGEGNNVKLSPAPVQDKQINHV